MSLFAKQHTITNGTTAQKITTTINHAHDGDDKNKGFHLSSNRVSVWTNIYFIHSIFCLFLWLMITIDCLFNLQLQLNILHTQLCRGKFNANHKKIYLFIYLKWTTIEIIDKSDRHLKFINTWLFSKNVQWNRLLFFNTRPTDEYEWYILWNGILLIFTINTILFSSQEVYKLISVSFK